MSPLTTAALPLLPLDAGVVLPGMTITLALETPEAAAAADAAPGAGNQLLLVPRRGRTGGPDASPGQLARIGTVATVERSGELPGGTRAIVVRGGSRATVGPVTSTGSAALWATADPVEEPPATGAGEEATRELRAVFDAIAEHRGFSRLGDVLRGVTDPGALADAAGYWPELSFERKIELLEAISPDRRVELVLGWAREALAELELKDRIRTDVAEGMERTQREYLLRQQLAAIRKELGEDGSGEGTASYRERLEALAVPDAARKTIEREIDKLERTSEQSPEHGWITTWLDTVFDLPWGTRSEDRLDIAEARTVLDADHTGLDDVKERIIEHLAVRKLRVERGLDRPGGDKADNESVATPAKPVGRRGVGGMILALVGPPGVGKTSLGESVARAMGRSFVRVALGGVRDEAEIRGHRRTYVGALPGRIVRAVKEAGTFNPVILLDEVDKLGADWRGDPSSALLEVLDPAQNHTFRDHYLDIDLDLSDVLFLATANMVEQIPGPLLDRMEIVRLDGYTEDEKVAIARDHLLARQLERAGLLEGEVVITDAALRAIASGYTREAGVRGLERELGKLLRKAAASVAQGPERPGGEAAKSGVTGPERPGGEAAKSGVSAPERPGGEAAGEAAVVVDEADVSKWLGRAKFHPEAPERTSVPGVATGLAVTGFGGDVLFVEASASDGEQGLTVTGQLGDVMQESAQIALSYVRAHADDVGVPAGAFDHRRVHVHVPAGAVPKDGPSAGVTMTTALVSLLSGRAVRPEVGMTGEVTLQGKVLPIGGVKQKVLAAHRAGLTEVILPARNEPDLDDVPEAVRAEMTFHLASDVGEVLQLALAS